MWLLLVPGLQGKSAPSKPPLSMSCLSDQSCHSLMAALWMAKCGVKARIIDAGATKIFRGHADAMQAGTLDIFDSFGMADELYTCSATTTEMSFWVRESFHLRNFLSHVVRTGRIRRFTC